MKVRKCICGNEPIVHHIKSFDYYIVNCDSCGLVTALHFNKSRAIIAWNGFLFNSLYILKGVSYG